MKFIKDDEFILLMEDQYGGKFTTDNLKRLRDVGVQTIVRYPFWSDIETSMGIYRWDVIDRAIDLTYEAGMKCLFGVYDKPPEYFPDEWYLKTPEGENYTGKYQERLLSPWQPDGWNYHLDFIERFCHRASDDDNVMCFRATTHGAESMYPHDLRFPYRLDGDYIETMLRVLLEEQGIFYNAHASHELWTCFHHSFDHQGRAGTEHAEMLYRAMWNEFPDAKHYCISYTQFKRGVQGEVENLADMKRLGLLMFAAAEYAEGLPVNTGKAIAQGFRGLVCGPIMNWSKHHKMEDWMYDAFRDSITRWRTARNV